MNIHEAVGAALYKDADDQADEWLRSQTRKERRRMSRKAGILKGLRAKGGNARAR